VPKLDRLADAGGVEKLPLRKKPVRFAAALNRPFDCERSEMERAL